MKKIHVILCLLFFSFISCGDSEEGQNGASAQLNKQSVLNPTSEYIAVFGDIQCLTVNKSTVSIYKHSLEWIEEQVNQGINIKAVLHTGDVTGSNGEDRWNLFYNATQEFALKIPFFTAIGDHDYTWTGQLISDRFDTRFNDYVNFPLSVSKIVDYFEEGRMENIIVENYIHGQPYYFLILEFGPRPEVIDWARMYVGNHSWINFILLNHEYLESRGGLRTTNLKCKARLRNTTYLTPTEVWEQLVYPYDNITCVLCGHVASLYALTYGTNSSYREVPQIQHNIQEEPYRYDNWLMLWEFPIESDSANVFIYNTKTEKYYNNKKILFKFKYTDNPPVSSVKKEAMCIPCPSKGEYDITGKKFTAKRQANQIYVRDGKNLLFLVGRIWM